MSIGINQNIPAGAVVTQVPSGTKTFGTAAPPVSPSNVVIVAANPNRVALLIVNAGSQIVYLGKDSTVSAANGLPLAAGLSIADDVTTDAWWGSAASGTGDIRYIEVSRGGS